MKFTICGFSQEKLVALGLDSIDALILRYFIDFKDSGNMKLEINNGRPYYWLNYKNLLQQLPIIRLNSKRVLRRRLERLEECGILEHYFKKEGGSYSFYAIGANYRSLIDTEGATLKSEGCDSKVRPGKTEKSDGCDLKVQQGATQKSNQNINLLKDSSIKDNNTKIEIDWKSILTAWNTLPDPIKNIQAITDSRKTKIKARINSLNLRNEDILKAIDNIKNSDFLQGKNDKGWVITFDWLFKDDTRFSKVFEGNYINTNKLSIQGLVKQNAAAYEPFNYS